MCQILVLTTILHSKMIKNSFIISVLLFALLLANSDLVSAENGGKSKGGKSKGGKSDKPKLADSTTAYKYTYLSNQILLEVDNIVNENITDVDVFYYDRVAPKLTPDIVWNITTPIITSELVGTEEVKTFWETIATRQFSNHVWSYNKVTKVGKDVQVEFRYYGIVLPAGDNSTYQDIFGEGTFIFKDDLLSHAFIVRSYTIDRGYGQNN